LLSACRAAHRQLTSASDVIEGDGNVTGEPLDAAHLALRSYYKSDEAPAFSVWASPRNKPRVLVVYFEARRQRRPIWVAIRQDGTELRTASQLPRGAFKAMRAISQEDDDWFAMWPEMIDIGDEPTRAHIARTGGRAHRRGAPSAVPHAEETREVDASVRPLEDAGSNTAP
jgi:hypothetical protein